MKGPLTYFADAVLSPVVHNFVARESSFKKLTSGSACIGDGLIGINITAVVPSSAFETNRLADTLCLLAKRLQLRLYEFGLNSNNVTEILCMTQFLNEFVRDSEVFSAQSF